MLSPPSSPKVCLKGCCISPWCQQAYPLSKASIFQILPWNLHAHTNSTNLNTVFHWAHALQVLQTPNNAAVALRGLPPPLSSLTSKISFQNISQTLVRTNTCCRSWSLRGHNNQSLNHTTNSTPHQDKILYTISSSLPTHRHIVLPIVLSVLQNLSIAWRVCRETG